MANVLEDSEASGSDSESDTEEVFPDFTLNFTKAELAESLNEILEKYQQIRVKFKKLKMDLASDSEKTESLGLENYELREKFQNYKMICKTLRRKQSLKLPAMLMRSSKSTTTTFRSF